MEAANGKGVASIPAPLRRRRHEIGHPFCGIRWSSAQKSFFGGIVVDIAFISGLILSQP